MFTTGSHHSMIYLSATSWSQRCFLKISKVFYLMFFWAKFKMMKLFQHLTELYLRRVVELGQYRHILMVPMKFLSIFMNLRPKTILIFSSFLFRLYVWRIVWDIRDQLNRRIIKLIYKYLNKVMVEEFLLELLVLLLFYAVKSFHLHCVLLPLVLNWFSDENKPYENDQSCNDNMQNILSNKIWQT